MESLDKGRDFPTTQQTRRKKNLASLIPNDDDRWQNEHAPFPSGKNVCQIE